MQSTSVTAFNLEKFKFSSRMSYFKVILLQVLFHFCDISAFEPTKELTDNLDSIGSKSSPNWKENPNINMWALVIKSAAQALISQAKEYTDAHGLIESKHNDGDTDHDRVLCIWKLYFATFLVQHLHVRLELLKRPVGGVTTVVKIPVIIATVDDCHNMFEQIIDISNPIIALDSEGFESFFGKLQRNIYDEVFITLNNQKLHECIADQNVDITDSAKAITFGLGLIEFNLFQHIKAIVDTFCPYRVGV
ncbi:hypothetical protein H4219_003645 [Mycoemilia scoparia]|uniref:Uncharacterized protein n=1 Tax=Mycoemilia scoparia TaxID=417184 RepID=A0A9W7ZZX4_9FUNG|nr:hypothetical protein H4219_003645 [Mycoemilia scoparia]